MDSRESILGAWQAAALEEGMLPSGVTVRLEKDLTAVGMVQRGIMPTELRTLALQFSSGEGVTVSALDEVEAARFRHLELVYITQLVREVKTPGSDDFVPWRVTVEDLTPPAEGEPERKRMPAKDVEALQDIVRRRRTLRQVDALSRLQHGLLEPEEAAAITDEEFPKTILAWRSFRDQLRSSQRGAGRKDVEQPPVAAADHLGSGGKPRARRGPRAKAGKPQTEQPAA